VHGFLLHINEDAENELIVAIVIDGFSVKGKQFLKNGIAEVFREFVDVERFIFVRKVEFGIL
jgi:hypothetical protein